MALSSNKQLLKPATMKDIVNKYASEITSETSQQEILKIITNIIADTVNAIDHDAIANIAIEGINKRHR